MFLYTALEGQVLVVICTDRGSADSRPRLSHCFRVNTGLLLILLLLLLRVQWETVTTHR